MSKHVLFVDANVFWPTHYPNWIDEQLTKYDYVALDFSKNWTLAPYQVVSKDDLLFFVTENELREFMTGKVRIRCREEPNK